jgi:hypothetical protein
VAAFLRPGLQREVCTALSRYLPGFLESSPASCGTWVTVYAYGVLTATKTSNPSFLLSFREHCISGLPGLVLRLVVPIDDRRFSSRHFITDGGHWASPLLVPSCRRWGMPEALRPNSRGIRGSLEGPFAAFEHAPLVSVGPPERMLQACCKHAEPFFLPCNHAGDAPWTISRGGDLNYRLKWRPFIDSAGRLHPSSQLPRSYCFLKFLSI